MSCQNIQDNNVSHFDATGSAHICVVLQAAISGSGVSASGPNLVPVQAPVCPRTLAGNWHNIGLHRINTNDFDLFTARTGNAG